MFFSFPPVVYCALSEITPKIPRLVSPFWDLHVLFCTVRKHAALAFEGDPNFAIWRQVSTSRTFRRVNADFDRSLGAYTYFRITVTYSDDQGKSWKYLSAPASDIGPVNGNWEPFLRLALDGSIQIYYSRENSATDQDSLERVSTDGGKTWSSARTISGSGITARDGMLGVATIAGSNLMAVFESETNGVFNIMSITSADDGKTWSNRRIVYESTVTGNSAGAPQIIDVGGNLVVSFQTSEDSNLGQVGAYTSHTAAKVISSSDGGNTWGNKLTVFSEQSAWPSLLTLDKGSFLALADHGGSKARRVNM